MLALQVYCWLVFMPDKENTMANALMLYVIATTSINCFMTLIWKRDSGLNMLFKFIYMCLALFGLWLMLSVTVW